MTNPIIIETDLKDILAKMENRLDRIEQKLEVLPRMEADIAQLKTDVSEIKSRSSAQIWALIGIIFTAVVGTLIKFGFFPTT